MRTVMRAAAVAAVAVATVAGTAVAANAAPATANYVKISAPSSLKAGVKFHVYGLGYDSRTTAGAICLQQRVKVGSHWTGWSTAICETNYRKGHEVGFDAYAPSGLRAGTYDLRLVLDAHPRAGVWKTLDYSAQHIVNVHR